MKHDWDNLIEFLMTNANLTNAVSTIASSAIALAAFLVSLASLYFSRRALKVQRKHNVLSVRPLPHVSIGDYENRLSVKIHNNGTGPAILKKITACRQHYSKPSLIDWMPDLPGGLLWDTFTGASQEPRSLRPDGEIVLLQLIGQTEKQLFVDARDKVRKRLSELTVVVEYTDIYQTSFPRIEKKLDWFGRHVRRDEPPKNKQS